MSYRVIVASLALGLVACAGVASGRTAPRAVAARIDPAPIVARVRALLAANYVVHERRAALDAALADGLAAHRYDGLDALALAQRINGDLAAVAHDKHLGVRYDPPRSADLAAATASGRGDDDEDDPRQARRHNSGVTKLEMLPGNVRYMKYDGFMWTRDASKAAIDTAMAFLSGGDAIIIDLRENGGGSPAAVNYLTSYFVPVGTRLVSFQLKNEAPTESVSQKVAGKPIANIPAYVLTSGGTASAAEEFASHVARFGFAKLVGATTAGAAYRNELYALPQGFVISISIGRPELPGGGNWEGKGVTPAIVTPAAAALDAAERDAYTGFAAKGDAASAKSDTWLAQAAAARLAGTPAGRPLAAYAGAYGPFHFTVVGDHLNVVPPGDSGQPLTPLGGDVFAVADDPLTHIRFDAKGSAVTRFTVENPDAPMFSASRE